MRGRMTRNCQYTLYTDMAEMYEKYIYIFFKSLQSKCKKIQLTFGVNIALRRFLHNHGNIATGENPKSELCPTLIE